MCGLYMLKIVDLILFVKNFVLVSYFQLGQVFDFIDLDNVVVSQLFNEVVVLLVLVFSLYMNDLGKGNCIIKLQQDLFGFVQSLLVVVEQGYQWKLDCGLVIVKIVIVLIEYDVNICELLKIVQCVDVLFGLCGNFNLQVSVVQGIQLVGENGGVVGLVGVGMVLGMFGVGGMQQLVMLVVDDLVVKLKKVKEMLDLGLIIQGDYDVLKVKVLGL